MTRWSSFFIRSIRISITLTVSSVQVFYGALYCNICLLPDQIMNSKLNNKKTDLQSAFAMLRLAINVRGRRYDLLISHKVSTEP